MHDSQMSFMEDAHRLLGRQVGRQLELCRELLAREGSAELRELKASVQTVAQQLEQLADFARELRPVTSCEFSFVELVALAQELVEAGVQARDLELSVEVHPSLEGPWVADKVAFRQILLNKLSLAVQSSQGTVLNVALTTSRPGGEELVARMVVNGAALDEKSLPVLALRHSVERLGGRVFTAGSVYAVSLPMARPVGYCPALVEEAPKVTVAVADEPVAVPVAAPIPNLALGAAGRALKRLAAERDWSGLEQACLELEACAPKCLQRLQYLSLAIVQQGGEAFPVLRQLAVGYFEHDHCDEGRALLRQMLPSLPGAASGVLVAEDLVSLGEFALAETFFREAADRHFAAGDLRAGVAVLQRLQVVKPDDVGLGQAIAGVLVRLGEYRLAVKAYRDVLREQPDHQPALEGLSLAAELAGDSELTALAQRRLRSVAA